MNIFVLDADPALAAQYQCDKHVVKMILETAQLLCSVFENGLAPYRKTHYNHPCSKWARASGANFDWLVEHALALSDEYELRYGRVHKSREVIEWCRDNKPQMTGDITPFPLAMPDEYKTDNVVDSYRLYYIKEKGHFAKWNKNRKPPIWWPPERLK